MQNKVVQAVIGCRLQILSIFLAYVISCTIGIVMVHQGNQFALAYGDKIVGAAVQTDNASLEYQAGNKLSAALHDFVGNLFLAAIPQTVIGLGIVPPYLTVAYQGWVGGIVSVDRAHQSRLTDFHSAAYYFLVLFLQMLAFSLSIGAGVRCGMDAYRHNAEVGWKVWDFRIPKESLINVARVYLVSAPIFLVGSLVEFLSPWNR